MPKAMASMSDGRRSEPLILATGLDVPPRTCLVCILSESYFPVLWLLISLGITACCLNMPLLPLLFLYLCLPSRVFNTS